MEGPAGGRAKWTSPEFGEIYEEHSRQIYYLALRFLGDPTQAEDATHDVFLKAYRKLSEFRGDSAMRTWLYRITINHCKNLLQTWHQRNMVSNSDDAFWEGAVASTEGRGPGVVRLAGAFDPSDYRLGWGRRLPLAFGSYWDRSGTCPYRWRLTLRAQTAPWFYQDSTGIHQDNG